MSEGIKVGHLYPMKVTPSTYNRKQANNTSDSHANFQKILNSEFIKFSHHAEVRMAQRGISLPTESLSQISDALDSAAKKGATDSLILLGDIAMIVNVPTRTVVTALDGEQMKSNVFTQIDSAIIIS